MLDIVGAMREASELSDARRQYALPRYQIIEKDFRIMPKDIPSDFDQLWGAFDQHETDVSAEYILLYCQEQGDWRPFSLEQINTFYQRKGEATDSFYFNRLVEPGWHSSLGERRLVGGGWIVRNSDSGLFWITDDFILRVYKSATRQKNA